ncbi:MAG: polysaccharide export protein [Gammaproteobacteria bacterium]|jgi:polysaccharide export outer membrane protein|nr:polysaccharide export protein [Gammaproteobacteria bacterium]
MKNWWVVLLALLCFTAIANEAENYKLGPGDVIVIQVFGEDELKLETQLTDSGTVNYPFLGTIKVVGMSIKELEQHVYNGLKPDYFVEPNVFVGIVQYRPFYIHGEVKKPGGYPYQPGMTVNQAIALAGGLTERASKEKIEISREGDKNNTQTGTLNTKISAGDTITIEQRFF